MARIKLSAHLARKGLHQKSDSKLYKRFKGYFEELIDRGGHHFTSKNLRDWYVPNEKHADAVVDLLNDSGERHIFLTGVRGIGKSTLMRWLLTPSSNPHILRAKVDGNAPNADETTLQLSGTSLVIPMDLGGKSFAHGMVERHISTQLSAANSLLKRTFMVEVTRQILGEFILGHNERLLNYYIDNPADIDDFTTEQKVRLLGEKWPYAYAAEELKYCLAQIPEIDRVVFYFDNIEPQPLEMQKEFIKGAISFFQCFRNTEQTTGPTPKLNLIFSLRPATLATLREESELDTFIVPADAVYISAPPDLVAIFQRRFEAAISLLGEGIVKLGHDSESTSKVKNKEDWHRAYDAFTHILAKFNSESANSLIRLCNMDLRLGARKIAQVLQASHWMEYDGTIDTSDPGAFKIEESGYRVTQANFLRALILGHFEVFRPDPNNPDTVAFNLFANEQDGADDLMVAYITKLFVRKAVDDPERRGVIKLSGRDIHRYMHKLYEEGVFEEYGPLVLQAMIKWGLLRIEGKKSGLPIDQENFRDFEYIGQSRLYELFSLLEKSSVYLEMCRDDTFLEKEVLGPISNATAFLPREELLPAVINLARFFLLREQQLIYCFERQARGNKAFLHQHFGDALLARRLLAGIRSSYTNYFGHNMDRSGSHTEAFSRLAREVDEAQRHYEA